MTKIPLNIFIQAKLETKLSTLYRELINLHTLLEQDTEVTQVTINPFQIKRMFHKTSCNKVRMVNYIWDSSQENLSSGFLTK